MTDAPEAEFPRPVAIDALVAGETRTGEASEAERAALARRYAIPAVRGLRFRAQAQPWGPGGWRIDGVVAAELTQTCVLTLDPVDTALEERFTRYFAPAKRMDQTVGLLDPETDEDPEPLGAAIDFGEIAAEAAALAMDPYPRRPDAGFQGVVQGPPGVAPMTDEDARPFARLAALRKEAGEA